VKLSASARELIRLVPLLGLYLAVLVLFPQHEDDEASYIDLAHRLTHGTYTTGNDGALLDADPTSPDLWFGPGLPGLLSPLVALNAPTFVLRATGPVLLFAAVVVFYVLARRRWSPRTALVASYAFGLYPPFWPLIRNVHGEPLAVLLTVSAMLGLARFLGSRHMGSLVLASLSFAGLALTRVAYGWVLTIVLLVCVALWLTRRNAVTARVAATFAVALLACTPWLLYTYARTDRPFQWGNSGALSLYWMASPYAGDRGDWRQANDVFTDPRLAAHRPFFERLRALSLDEQNREIERKAIENIVDHPLEYMRNVAANASRLLFNVPYSDSPWRPNDLFYALPNALLVAGAVFAAVVLTPRRRRLPAETGPYALVALVAIAVHLLLSAYPRMLAPVVPLVVWLATLAVVESGAATSVGRVVRDRDPRSANA
jgi:4-amino-4-deoxy-L-arabinose transferase-like glycosyltransferase